MSIVLPFEGGPFDGQTKLYSGEREIRIGTYGVGDTWHQYVYKVVTVGICRIPVKYKYEPNPAPIHS